ncbi:MerR family transcriptional regulator [Aeromicrobium sp. IC_218]|uniref:MerR family transcriptional regulator n=1 Tax=Aeromicrobium sp. IC_218 TaxID=2545468 RepID=UPI00103FBCA8|nr:MerR family transcriptional regulator [Aeromicrobium sp. IC_218]TCI96017.1 MerR family transcriptional regulator [Aeromicrobium sp. IC_218]
MSHGAPASEEFTIDELAQRADMTVRNVRAYSGRGLIPPPRLEGRTGYYNQAHLQKLRLVRELLDRGYTLAAVEKAMLSNPSTASSHALDLLQVLDSPGHEEEPEQMSRDALAALAGVGRDDALIDALVEYGLAEHVDDDMVRLLSPTVVRAGAAAVALGLSTTTVMALFPLMRESLSRIADAFVASTVDEIVQPFLDAGMPEGQWPDVVAVVERLIPVASQVTLGIFRRQLGQAIEHELGEKLAELGYGTPEEPVSGS